MREGKRHLMNWTEFIEVNPDIQVGKPVIKGTRLAVELILDLMAGGADERDILSNYPNLRPEHLRACVGYAAQLVKDERVYPRGA